MGLMMLIPDGITTNPENKIIPIKKILVLVFILAGQNIEFSGFENYY
jgi:hypothetical protein